MERSKENTRKGKERYETENGRIKERYERRAKNK